MSGPAVIDKESSSNSPETGEIQHNNTPQTNKPAANQAAANQVRVDDSNANCSYANFCRVTGTPEELILDFGLNSQPFGTPTDPIELKQRLVVNYFTAKRLLHALHLSVQRHEQAFGALEVGVQKRVTGRAAVGG